MINSLFNAIDISASGLNVQRTKMNIISENIANAETTRAEDGNPYRRKIVLSEAGIPGKKFSEIYHENKLKMERTKNPHMPDEPFKDPTQKKLTGVHVADIVEDMSPFKMVYDPSHPDADKAGYVSMPNINVVQEMTSLITTSRAFEANITAINSSKEMIRKALKL